jgi:hypothetical protein
MEENAIPYIRFEGGGNNLWFIATDSRTLFFGGNTEDVKLNSLLVCFSEILVVFNGYASINLNGLTF